ncbi:hypothetical protein F5Y00DRAFT_245705, partial [Daldinia vernicosa]|uniref:uncharacterized protein n=1 Tax=Daldinia vernicosa TaxID=114800 RepID=UPI002008940C
MRRRRTVLYILVVLDTRTGKSASLLCLIRVQLFQQISTIRYIGIRGGMSYVTIRPAPSPSSLQVMLQPRIIIAHATLTSTPPSRGNSYSFLFSQIL